MVSKRVTFAIVVVFVSGLLGAVMATFDGIWIRSSIRLIGPVYFSPQLALVAGFVFAVMFGILHAFGFFPTADK